MYLLANTLKEFTFVKSDGVQRSLLDVLQGTTEIVLKTSRMGGENAIINLLNEVD